MLLTNKLKNKFKEIVSLISNSWCSRSRATTCLLAGNSTTMTENVPHFPNGPKLSQMVPNDPKWSSKAQNEPQ